MQEKQLYARYARLNGFYKKKDIRFIIFNLYKGRCKGCNKTIAGKEYDVSHIVPRSRPEMFERFFAGLDVDNLLNLQLLCQKCNRQIGNSFIPSEHLIYNLISYSVKLIDSRLHKILESKPNLLLLEDYLTPYCMKLDLSKYYKEQAECFGEFHKINLDKLNDELVNTSPASLTTEESEYLLLVNKSFVIVNEYENQVFGSQSCKINDKPWAKKIIKECQSKMYSKEIKSFNPRGFGKSVYLDGPRDKAEKVWEICFLAKQELIWQNLLRSYHYITAILDKRYRYGKYIITDLEGYIEKYSLFSMICPTSMISFLRNLKFAGKAILNLSSFSYIHNSSLSEGSIANKESDDVEKAIALICSKNNFTTGQLLVANDIMKCKRNLEMLLNQGINSITYTN